MCLDEKDGLMTAPTVSIILATYNGAAFLREAVESCLGQTFRDLELVVVDDGSSNPRTAEILGSFEDERLRVIRQDPNQGLPAALNRGFRESRGRYLTWTSDDNLYRPEALARMLEVMEAEGVDFVYAACSVIDEQGRIVGAIQPREQAFLAIDNCVGACFLYARRVYETIGDFDPTFRLVEDYDYWARVCRRFSMRLVDADLYLYRQHGGSLTTAHRGREIDEKIEAVRHQHFPSAWILRAEGLRAFQREDFSASRWALLGAFCRRPWWLGLLRPLAITWLPRALVRWIVAAKRKCP